MKRMLWCAAVVLACLGIRNFHSEAGNSPETRMEAQPVRAPAALLYFRVAKQQTKQLKYDRIKEVRQFLKSAHLSCVCGELYRNNRLDTRWVAITIFQTGWRSYLAKDQVHRGKIISKMSELGIETSLDKPEDLDD
jgi:hypothetical protein